MALFYNEGEQSFNARDKWDEIEQIYQNLSDKKKEALHKRRQYRSRFLHNRIWQTRYKLKMCTI